MNPITYECPADKATAIASASNDRDASYLAGGTTLVDLMKEGVLRPLRLVDVSRLAMTEITRFASGAVRIGANVKNAQAARDPDLLSTYPGICEAILSGASQQIRNMATMAGNILQRTRCPYLRDAAQACNKRDPGSGCAAINGYNRTHAIFGQTDDGASDPRSCIATYPSDMAVALAAHEAVVVTQSAYGEKRYPISDLLRLPGDAPHIDSNLLHGELIVAIELPPFHGASHYLKVRDRASYAFALVSCAVAVEMKGDRIDKARIALGSVAHKPWRVPLAEAMLEGRNAEADLFRQAAAVALESARPYAMNEFKIPLARELIARGLLQATGLAPMEGVAGTAFAASVGGVAVNNG